MQQSDLFNHGLFCISTNKESPRSAILGEGDILYWTHGIPGLRLFRFKHYVRTIATRNGGLFLLMESIANINPDKLTTPDTEEFVVPIGCIRRAEFYIMSQVILTGLISSISHHKGVPFDHLTHAKLLYSILDDLTDITVSKKEGIWKS